MLSTLVIYSHVPLPFQTQNQILSEGMLSQGLIFFPHLKPDDYEFMIHNDKTHAKTCYLI